MNLTIKNLTPYSEDISVMIEDECNHAGAEVEMLEYSKDSFWADAGVYVNDDSEMLPTLVCKCGFEELQEPDECSFESEYDYDV